MMLFARHPERVIWNEVECGAYEADLPLWEELAAPLGKDDQIMELGCGAGRVVHYLAAHSPCVVTGFDNDPNLVEAVWDKEHGTTGDAEHADVRDFDFPDRYALVLAPMQLIQLLANREERLGCLRCVVDSMVSGARAAFAIVEEMPPPPESGLPPLPDVREVDGWVYSSQPLEPEIGPERILLRRRRQTVDPEGRVTERMNEVELRTLSAEDLEEEAAEAGLRTTGRREIPATDAHVASTAVLMELDS